MERQIQPIPCTIEKINTKWTIDLNVQPKTTQYLEGNTGENLWVRQRFLRYNTKSIINKRKNDKLSFIKI